MFKIFQDVCSMEKDYGPCVGRFYKWYYDNRYQYLENFLTSSLTLEQNKLDCLPPARVFNLV
jgi:hypothetical protein